MAERSDRRMDIRRLLLLLIGLGCLATGVASAWTQGDEGGRSFASNSAFRMGVVMIALWLALPTLNKPMRWLPPGVAVGCLIAIGVIAANPRLVVVVVPAVVFLLSLTWLVRMFRVRHSR